MEMTEDMKLVVDEFSMSKYANALERDAALVREIVTLRKDKATQAGLVATGKRLLADEMRIKNERTEECLRLRGDVRHWMSNHDNRVEAARVLIERTDLPLERIEAYPKYLDALRKAKYWQGLINILSGLGLAVLPDPVAKYIKDMNDEDEDLNDEDVNHG